MLDKEFSRQCHFQKKTFLMAANKKTLQGYINGFVFMSNTYDFHVFRDARSA